jgi:hypothetical protein
MSHTFEPRCPPAEVHVPVRAPALAHVNNALAHVNNFPIRRMQQLDHLAPTRHPARVRVLPLPLARPPQVQPRSGRSLTRVRSTPRIAPVLHLCVQDTSRFPSKRQRWARPDSSPLPSKRKVRSSHHPLVLPLRLVMQGRALQPRSSAHGGCGW